MCPALRLVVLCRERMDPYSYPLHEMNRIFVEWRRHGSPDEGIFDIKYSFFIKNFNQKIMWNKNNRE